VLTGLYYVPIVIAAIGLGIRGALIVAFAAGALQTVTDLQLRGVAWGQPLAQTIMFACVGLTAATLARWLRTSTSYGDRLNVSGPGLVARSYNDPQLAHHLSALNRVVRGLSGQIRTPLTSVEGAGWVLEDSRLPDDKRQEFIAIVRKEAHRANRVLSIALDYAQPRKPRFRRTDLAPLVEEAIQLTDAADGGQLVVFRRDIPPDFPPLWCDPEQIRQVLLNVIMNSIQASTGGGKIDISAQVKDFDAVITVRDYGRGIAKEHRDRIFDPFFTTHENSLGLGLAIALQIITEHGGRIDVEAESAVGCCISITLALA
jgi:signal transduction histidine kinase